MLFCTYLYTRASVRIVKSRDDVLQICSYLSHLRHPHLEQVIGVVTKGLLQDHYIVTVQQIGKPIASFLSHSVDNINITEQDALMIGAQACQALYYLHEITGMGHPSLCAHLITYDEYRKKTVMLLTFDCPKCYSSYKLSRRNDVRLIIGTIVKLLSIAKSSGIKRSENEKYKSAESFISCVRTSTSMKELCTLLSMYAKMY